MGREKSDEKCKKKKKFTKKKQKKLIFRYIFLFFYLDIFIYFFIKFSFIYRESTGSCLPHLYELFFFNFNVFSTFILNILCFKVDFCYIDEQILIAVVRKPSKIGLLCFLGILSCKF